MVFTPTNQKTMQAVITADTKAKAWNEKERARKVLILNLFFSTSEAPSEEKISSPRNQTIGMTVLLVHLMCLVQLHGMAKDTLLVLHQSLATLPTIRHMLFWVFAAHDQLAQERQSECS